MVHTRFAPQSGFAINLPLALTIAMVTLLWVAGGAARADAMGQVVVRAGCWGIIIAAILVGPRPRLVWGRPVLILLLATIALPLIQLVPLPPAWWQALPGRDILLIPGEPVPWRPWTMTPGATRNALAALIVPTTMFLLLAQGDARVHRAVPSILLVMISASLLLGLLQFSGARFNNPFLNETPGAVSSIFANRNHFALLLAIGCLIAPVWAFMDRQSLGWRGPLAGGLVLLFVLTVLATGSRGGMVLGAISVALALALIGQRLWRQLGKARKWLFPTLIGILALIMLGLIALSFSVDRAEAIDRLIAFGADEDMRSRALPTVVSMIHTYMPFGSGFGSFDPVFRIHEPIHLLKLTYFNQAHNDYLGIALDGGIAGIAVLATGTLWWLVATIRVWRAASGEAVFLGRLGSAILLLVFVASIFDYPARTPTIMAIIVIAAMALARANADQRDAALP